MKLIIANVLLLIVNRHLGREIMRFFEFVPTEKEPTIFIVLIMLGIYILAIYILRGTSPILIIGVVLTLINTVWFFCIMDLYSVKEFHPWIEHHSNYMIGFVRRSWSTSERYQLMHESLRGVSLTMIDLTDPELKLLKSKMTPTDIKETALEIKIKRGMPGSFTDYIQRNVNIDMLSMGLAFLICAVQIALMIYRS